MQRNDTDDSRQDENRSRASLFRAFKHGAAVVDDRGVRALRLRQANDAQLESQD